VFLRVLIMVCLVLEVLFEKHPNDTTVRVCSSLSTVHDRSSAKISRLCHLYANTLIILFCFVLLL